MESSSNNSALIVIVGPTASGKSAIALSIAKKHNGEIVAADSRTVYRGINIGTAKPNAKEQAEVPHHLIDIVDPDEPFTVADFQKQAIQCIDEIAARGKVPILVGGTGLYIDSVLFGFGFQKPGDLSVREKLQRLSVEELQRLLEDKQIALPENAQNPRHLVRRLETGNCTPKSATLRANTLILGMEVERQKLKERIAGRVAAMLSAGLEKEVRWLAGKYGWSCRALQTIGYREFEDYFAGRKTLEETQAKIVQDTQSYAKRQRTWFARNKSIHWVREHLDIEDLITTFLSK